MDNSKLSEVVLGTTGKNTFQTELGLFIAAALPHHKPAEIIKAMEETVAFIKKYHSEE